MKADSDETTIRVMQERLAFALAAEAALESATQLNAMLAQSDIPTPVPSTVPGARGSGVEML